MSSELKAQHAELTHKTVTLRDMIGSSRFRSNLSKILPSHQDAERFAIVCMRTLSDNPKLMDCTPNSVIGSFMQAGALGLELGINGEAYLIPYKGVAQLQIGYQGLTKLAWNSDRIACIHADVVTHKEVAEGAFEYRRGTSPFINHDPMYGRDVEEDDIAYVYTIIWIKDSSIPLFDVLDYKAVERIRGFSKSAMSPAWVDHWSEQAKGKVLKRTLKLVPKSREQATAIAMEDANEVRSIKQVFDLDRETIETVTGMAEPIDVTPPKKRDDEAGEAQGESSSEAKSSGGDGSSGTAPSASPSTPSPASNARPKETGQLGFEE